MTFQKTVIASMSRSLGNPLSLNNIVRVAAMLVPPGSKLLHILQSRYESIVFSAPKLEWMQIQVLSTELRTYRSEIDPYESPSLLHVYLLSSQLIDLLDVAAISSKGRSESPAEQSQPVEMEKAAEDIFPPQVNTVAAEPRPLSQVSQANSHVDYFYGMPPAIVSEPAKATAETCPGRGDFQPDDSASRESFEPLVGTYIEMFREEMLAEENAEDMGVANWYVNYGGLLHYYCDVLSGIDEVDADEEHEVAAKELKREAAEVADTLDISKAYAAFLMGAYVMQETIRIESDLRSGK